MLFLKITNSGKEKVERGIAMMITTVSQTPNRISFSWTKTSSPVRVLKDGKEIYNGSEAAFTDKGLTPGTLYTYMVVGSETIKIQTATAVEREDKNQDIPLQELIVTTIIRDGEVYMAWEPIRGISEYEIYRNSTYAGTVTEPGFHDTNLKAEETYFYEIKGMRPLEMGDEESKKNSSLIAKLINFLKTKKRADDLLVEAFFINKEIGRLSDHISEKTPAVHDEFKIRYTTFLADEWVANPNVLSPMRYFTGDARSFDPEGESYRTRATVEVFGSEVKLTRDVGITEGYSFKKELIERKKASEQGIIVKNVKKDEEKVSLLLDHSVGNPLVKSPNIVYKVYMTFYKNGVFDLSGEHDESPHHEVYLKQGEIEWKPLHRSKNRGLDRLAPQAANRFWRYSNIK